MSMDTGNKIERKDIKQAEDETLFDSKSKGLLFFYGMNSQRDEQEKDDDGISI